MVPLGSQGFGPAEPRQKVLVVCLPRSAARNLDVGWVDTPNIILALTPYPRYLI